MNFSSIAIEQREKEVKALKTFLVFSTIGSLVLHVAVLASGIGSLLARVPELDEEKPIELTFVEPEVKDTPIRVEKKPLPEEPKLGVGDILTSSSGGGGSAGGGSAGGASTQSSQLQAQVPVTVQAPLQAPVPIQKNIEKPVEKPVIPQTFTPQVQKLVENFKRESVIRPQPQKEDVVTSKEPQKQVDNTPKETTSVQKIQESQPSTKVATNNTPVQSSTSNQNSENLRNTLGNVRDSRASLAGSGESSSRYDQPAGSGNSTIASGSGTGNGTGNGTGTGVGFGTGSGTGTGFGNGSGNGIGSGTGSGTGTGSGNGSGNGIGSGTGTGTGSGSGIDRGREVATAPRTPILPKPETKPRTSSRLNTAECEKCELKYPERARRRGVEGSPNVQFDVDENGRTTNVRLARSSGDSELDAAAVEQAREFRLKPSAAGRRNVQVSANFVQKGSHREREVQERRRQREQRRQQSEAQESQQVASNNTTRRRKRQLNPSNQSSDSGSQLRSVLRDSRESAPAAPSSGGEGE